VAKKKIYFSILAVFVFIAYTLLAAQPIPPETILTNNWIVALDRLHDEEAIAGGSSPAGSPANLLIPFSLGNRFGYVDSGGRLIMNREQQQYISLSPEYWAEYAPAPKTLVINDPQSDFEIILEDPRGYPVFMDGRIFLISKDQTSLEELDREGNVKWCYDFEAPLTCIDAAGGYVLTGTLDGMIDLLDSNGKPVFPSFAPGASRIPVILGCRISSDGSKLAVVSGIDKQRFLFLEWYGSNDYRVTYHEFLDGEGFRREVHMSFIGNDTRLIFEQEAGLGIYDVKSRSIITLPLPEQQFVPSSSRQEARLQARLLAIDTEGGDGLLFYISSGSSGDIKRFVALKLPDMELINIPFKSDVSFLTRLGKELFIGGGTTIASFSVNRR
jgi:hypothetical protein